MIKIPSMGIHLFNTLRNKKEEFQPVEDGRIGLYVCGVTVYDHCHIGHARSAIVFDTIYRYFKVRGYDVTYVRNFTDIDDKIIRKANEEGIPWKEVADKYIRSFYEDMDALNIMRPTFEPKATDHIEEMVEMVGRLLEKGYAYRIDGDVYFSVESFRGYGGLSGRHLDDMMAGARVEVDERKKSPLDFALWKGSKEGEPYWVTPFGKGRPGWHIECSAMSSKYLGNPFDIHGGGKDLIFPHHENEKAQAECATGKQFVRYWVHNGFVNIDKEKMSKSLGNILLIKDFLKQYHPEVLRLFFLSTHYRNPIDYNEQSIEDTNSALYRLYHTLERVSEMTDTSADIPARMPEEVKQIEQRFYEAMDDDFNTAVAISCIFDISRILNRMVDEHDDSSRGYVKETYETFKNLSGILGLLNDDINAYHANEKLRHVARVHLSPAEVEQLIAERTLARKNKDYKKADEIRNTLMEKGIILMDTPGSTEWKTKNLSAGKGENS